MYITNRGVLFHTCHREEGLGMAITLNCEAYTEFRCFGIPDEYPRTFAVL